MKKDKTTLDGIRQFLGARKIAVAGVSRDPKKFGYQVFNELKGRGYELYPINPHADQLDGIQVYSQISSLPEEVKHLVILTPKKYTEQLVMEALAKGIDHLWIQQMSDTPEALRIAREAGVRLVSKECIFMWADPVKGFHKFHKIVRKLVGRLPN